MSSDVPLQNCTMGCPEGGADGNRQHVWDLLQGMRGDPDPVQRGVVVNYNISAYEGPDSRGRLPLPEPRESVTLTRPKDKR